MSTSAYLAFLGTALVILLIPGPDMLFCLATGMRGGRRAGFGAAWGVATGEIVHIGLSAAGLAAIFRAAPVVYDTVRIVGAVYLVALGVSTLRHRGEHATAPHARAAPRRSYVRGLTTNLLNPKMALFAIALLPQFVDRHAGNVGLQFLVLGATSIVLDLVVLCAAGVLAARFAAFLRGRRPQRRLDTVAGVVYLGLGAKVALTD